MELLRELFNLTEDTTTKKKKKGGLKTAAQKVYHRDYIKTKNKDYRQYDADERKDD